MRKILLSALCGLRLWLAARPILAVRRSEGRAGSRQRAVGRPGLRDAAHHDAVAQAIRERRVLRRGPRGRGARQGRRARGRALDRPGRGAHQLDVPPRRGLAAPGRRHRRGRNQDRVLRRRRDLDRRQLAAGGRHRRARRRGLRRNRRGLCGQGRARQDRARLRQPGARHGAGRLEARRSRDPVLVLLAPQSSGRFGGPGGLDIRPGDGRPEGREDDVRHRDLGARGQGAVGSDERRGLAPLGRRGRRLRFRAAAPAGCRRLRRPPRSEDRHGRGPHPGHGSLSARGRAHGAPAGGEVLGERRPVGGREHPRDRPRADAPHRRGQASPSAPEHPVLVGRRDLLRVPVFRRPPRGGEKVPRQPQPGHGRSEAVGGASHAVHGAHAVGRALVSLRRPAEHPRGRRPGEQRLSRRLAGADAGAGAGLLEADLFPARHARAVTAPRPFPTSTPRITSCSTIRGSACRERR